jgi:hypothetical protein
MHEYARFVSSIGITAQTGNISLALGATGLLRANSPVGANEARAKHA